MRPSDEGRGPRAIELRFRTRMLRQQPRRSLRARRVPTVRALRQKLNLTQEEFAQRFHLPLGTVRDWE